MIDKDLNCYGLGLFYCLLVPFYSFYRLHFDVSSGLCWVWRTYLIQDVVFNEFWFDAIIFRNVVRRLK